MRFRKHKSNKINGIVFLETHDQGAVYDGAMESSFRHPPHQQLLKRQTVIGETLEHRRGRLLVLHFKTFGIWIDTLAKRSIFIHKIINPRHKVDLRIMQSDCFRLASTPPGEALIVSDLSVS